MQAIEQAYNRYVLRSDPDLGTEGMHEAIPDMHVEFNRYRSTAVVPDPGYVDDGALDIDPRQSRGLPGTRAPHVELSRGRQDDVDARPVRRRVRADGRPGRCGMGRGRSDRCLQVGVNVVSHVVGDDLVDRSGEHGAEPFSTAYGIGPSGASLVRPDGYVAWRATTHTADAADRLTAALRQVLGR